MYDNIDDGPFGVTNNYPLKWIHQKLLKCLIANDFSRVTLAYKILPNNYTSTMKNYTPKNRKIHYQVSQKKIPTFTTQTEPTELDGFE